MIDLKSIPLARKHNISVKTHNLKQGDWVIVKKGIYWSIPSQENCLFKQQAGQIIATTYTDNACFIMLQSNEEILGMSENLIYFYRSE